MEKAFDAVAWMRTRRTEIDRQDEGLTWSERSRKTLEMLQHDPLWERLKDRVVRIGSPSVPVAGSEAS